MTPTLKTLTVVPRRGTGNGSIRGFNLGSKSMRALLGASVALLGIGSACLAQDQSLRGVYAPPGAMTPAAGKSAKATPLAGDAGAVGNGPRITISGAAVQGQTLPSDVKPAPMADRPGYGTAIVNGHRAIVDLSNNRIFQVTD
jgi:hypothetical protein